MKEFCKALVDTFGSKFLRKHNKDELRRIVGFNSARGFLSCVL